MKLGYKNDISCRYTNHVLPAVIRSCITSLAVTNILRTSFYKLWQWYTLKLKVTSRQILNYIALLKEVIQLRTDLSCSDGCELFIDCHVSVQHANNMSIALHIDFNIAVHHIDNSVVSNVPNKCL